MRQKQQPQQQEQTQMAQPQFTFEGGHLVMYHQDPAANLTMDPTVNDRDRMIDLLNSEKHLCAEYTVATNEASHDALCQIFQQNQEQCHQLERNLFNTAFNKGWYRLPVADAQVVAQAFQNAQKDAAQFPSQQGQQSAGAAATQTTQSGQMASQQLNQKVTQALQQAQQGRTPTGVTGRASH